MTYTRAQLDEAVRAAVEACPVCRSTSYCLSAMPGSSHWFVKCLECSTTGPTVHAPGDPGGAALLNNINMLRSKHIAKPLVKNQ